MLPLGSLTQRGFDLKFVQVSGAGQINSTLRAEGLLAGTVFPGSVPLQNNLTVQVAVEPGIINYNNNGGNVGRILPDVPFPGLLNAVDDFAMEAVAYLELRAGFYHFGVNSDDGFRVSPALFAGDAGNAITLGEFSGGRGSADTTFDVLVTADGLYPMRLIWEEGGGDANVEFWTQDLSAPGTVVRAVNGAGGVPAWRAGSAYNPGTLTITRGAGNIVISWSATQLGALEASNDITGPWATIPQAEVLTGATKSKTVPLNVAKRFYRLKRP
jgi:hypothetical protein